MGEVKVNSVSLPTRFGLSGKPLTFLLFALLLLATLSAQAAIFPVTNLNNSGAGSFRQAIINANSSAGADIIRFSVTGTISVIGNLPAITSPVSIDGTTAPGYVACGPPLISLDGGGGSGNGLQLLVGASGSTIAALNLRNFQLNAIQLIDADNCTIIANYIGTDATGLFAAPNGQNGVQVEVAANNNRIGGSDPCDRNVIAGNLGTGIALISSINDTIVGNYIGLSADGLSDLGNASNGIYMFAATGSYIGGLGTNDGNVISGQAFHGIVVDGGSNNTTIVGNLIGTNGTGTAAVGNEDSGILLINTDNLTIGGNTPAHRNVLSGSRTEFAIFLINTSGTTVQGNYIGTDITGIAPMPNDSGGIRLEGNVNSVTIGGTGTGEGNVIAHNAGFGVSLPQASVSQVLISRNSMFCNTGLGIDLGGLGNANYPAPIFSVGSTSGVTGSASPNATVELYYDSTCTATCQGKDFIASVSANGLGNWTYAGALQANSTIVAVAIDPGPSAVTVNNTSEFACFTLLPVEGLAFNAYPNGPTSVQLDWTTEFEVNSMRFDIERSYDGAAFAKIGDVPGSGNDADGHAYRFEDQGLSGGEVFYRLKQIDFNGDFDYSEVRTVRLLEPHENLQLFPQPADQELRVNFAMSGGETARYEVVDLQGKQIRAGELAVVGGTDLTIPVSRLADGFYILRLRTNSRIVSRRFVVQH
ncbi:MAG: T9SS type A sorting domain-containing protein [Bacteroidota bacterium]